MSEHYEVTNYIATVLNCIVRNVDIHTEGNWHVATAHVTVITVLVNVVEADKLMVTDNSDGVVCVDK